MSAVGERGSARGARTGGVGMHKGCGAARVGDLPCAVPPPSAPFPVKKAHPQCGRRHGRASEPICLKIERGPGTGMPWEGVFLTAVCSSDSRGAPGPGPAPGGSWPRANPPPRHRAQNKYIRVCAGGRGGRGTAGVGTYLAPMRASSPSRLKWFGVARSPTG